VVGLGGQVMGRVEAAEFGNVVVAKGHGASFFRMELQSFSGVIS
jgi:hypothetical protein